MIVPTKYHTTPADTYRKAGISTVIWANHNLRASIAAMREVSRRIYRDSGIDGVERDIASLEAVFELTGNQELAEAEKRYLPASREQRRAVVLAASRGAALGELTKDKPKCMIDVRGEPLLQRLVSALRYAGVRDVTVVRGYKKGCINLPSIKTLDNDLHATTGEAASLALATDEIRGDCVIAYGDVLFRQHYLDRLFETDADMVIAADALWRERRSKAQGWVRDLVSCSRPFSGDYLDDKPVTLVAMGNRLDHHEIHAEWIGLARLNEKGSAAVRAELKALAEDGLLPTASLVDLFHRLAGKGHEIRVVYVPGQWLDVDDAADLLAAGQFL